MGDNIRVLGKIRIDADGSESAMVYEIITAPSLADAEEWAKDARPSWGCTHSYDCCGRWYPGAARVTQLNDYGSEYVVSQSWAMNI